MVFTPHKVISSIQNPLLKSAELTGQWEKHLRDIENGEYSAKVFVDNMKMMVEKLVEEVRMAKASKIITTSARTSSFPKSKSKNTEKKKSKNKIEGAICPKCTKGKLLKGKTAFGCSRYQEGCGFRLPFIFMEKEIPERQLGRILKYGSTIQLAGFKKDGKKVKGNLKFNDNFELMLKEKEPRKIGRQTLKKKSPISQNKNADTIPCPKCGVGKVVKGNTAYGCSAWKNGCTWRFPFDDVRQKANGKSLKKGLVTKILKGEI